MKLYTFLLIYKFELVASVFCLLRIQEHWLTEILSDCSSKQERNQGSDKERISCKEREIKKKK